MFKDKRIPEILEMRKEGLSLEAIGRIFGLSKQRIGQLIVEGIGRLKFLQEKGDMDYDDVRRLDLSTRADGCLRNENIRTISKLTSMHLVDLLQVHHLGIGVLRELETKLKLFGKGLNRGGLSPKESTCKTGIIYLLDEDRNLI